MRISDHNLEIEKGRYYKIPRQDRLCKTCKCIEDESHFILNCKINSKLRENLYNSIKFDDSEFSNMTDEEKLVYLLSPNTFKHIRLIGFFLKQSLELRAEVS